MSFYDQEHDRDPRLGAALRALPTPEHGPSFWDDLHRDLHDVTTRPRVAVGGDPAEEPRVLATPEEVRTSAAATRRSTPRRLRQPRMPRPSRRTRRARSATSKRSVPRLGPSTPKRRRVRLLLVALAVLAVLGSLGWWAESSRRDDVADPDAAPATSAASATTTPVTAAPPVAGPPASWFGELERRETDRRGRTTTRRFSVVAQQDGATRITALDSGQPTDVGDDPAVGVRVTVGTGDTVRATGLPPGPLDDGGATAVLRRRYADVVAAQAAAGDPAVVAEELDGRSVWRTTSALVPDQVGTGGADQVELVVDQALRVPLHVVERRAGAVLRELTLTLAPDTPTPPPGLPPTDDDATELPGPWRRAAAADARLVVGMLPEGFVAVAAAVADDAPGLGAEGGNPSGRATQVVYRRGWEQVVVTVWATGPDPAAWSDPLAAEGVPLTPVAVPITDGALAGVTAQAVVQADAPPHLWAVHRDHVVLITGPLPAAGLAALASSLSPPR